ncbi:hypothetical protein ABT187_14295 [Streptomyces sp. NPDC001817]
MRLPGLLGEDEDEIEVEVEAAGVEGGQGVFRFRVCEVDAQVGVLVAQ